MEEIASRPIELIALLILIAGVLFMLTENGGGVQQADEAAPPEPPPAAEAGSDADPFQSAQASNGDAAEPSSGSAGGQSPFEAPKS